MKCVRECQDLLEREVAETFLSLSQLRGFLIRSRIDANTKDDQEWKRARNVRSNASSSWFDIREATSWETSMVKFISWMRFFRSAVLFSLRPRFFELFPQRRRFITALKFACFFNDNPKIPEPLGSRKKTQFWMEVRHEDSSDAWITKTNGMSRGTDWCRKWDLTRRNIFRMIERKFTIICPDAKLFREARIEVKRSEAIWRLVFTRIVHDCLKAEKSWFGLNIPGVFLPFTVWQISDVNSIVNPSP